MDYSIKIGGEAGQGIQTIGATLGKVFARSGYFVFTHQDYESRIRGGHNFYQIRFAEHSVLAPKRGINILVALDRASIDIHPSELLEGGITVYDAEQLKMSVDRQGFLNIPFNALAVKHGGSAIMANTVAVGAVLGMLGIDLGLLNEILTETFKKKGEGVIEANKQAAQAGWQYASTNCPSCAFCLGRKSAPKMLISGVDSIALGALASGLRFYAAYPMTPSTGIMNFLASNADEFGLIVEQAEDEIAAINMAIGASFAGVRAMTGTAGGGFALMTEGLSLAAMTETPVVIALGQRPAPATGFPTRTEQADLLFALHTAHGEFPRVVFAPGTPEQALYLTCKAFDLAEKYQIPAIILFDQHLADSEWSYDSLDITSLKYRDYRLRGEAFKSLVSYKRHAFTESGVSPLGVPGEARHLVVTDSDEHDEEGHIVEDAATRKAMVEKRFLKKLPLLKKEISQPVFYNPNDSAPECVLVCWGSNYGAVKETVDALSAKMSIAMLHFSEINPLPESADYLRVLEAARHRIIIENNASLQFARHLRAETGFEFSAHINKFDGRPFLLDELLEKVNATVGRL